jgi:hypothetical protein
VRGVPGLVATLCLAQSGYVLSLFLPGVTAWLFLAAWTAGWAVWIVRAWRRVGGEYR